jgi:hypothetical protein
MDFYSQIINSMNPPKSCSIILQILILYILTGFGKITAQEVLTTAGDSYTNANGSVSYTIGEPVIETFTGGNNILTQGFQQTNLLVTSIDEFPGLDYEISAFPNPAAEFVKLKIGKENIAGMQYMLYDLNGNLLIKNTLEGTETEIPFIYLSPAEYILKVSDNNKEVKSFKIVKTQ